MTSIVNAKICVELAEKTKTVGVKKDSNKADFGTVTGTIYATSDDGEFEKVKISPVEIYDEQENLIKKLKVEDYAYEGSKTEPLITYQSYTDLLAPGKYIIKVKAAGCEEQEKEITIKAGEMKLIDFSFEKKKKLSNSIYVGAVLDAIEDTKNYNGSDGYGALYDIDGNGQDELIMVYTANMDTGAGYGFPAKVCSVYGISNGKPVALIYKEVLFVEAGGSSGYAAVVQSDGNVYFAITSENGETSSEPGYSSNRNGRWGLYTIDGESLKLDINVGYNYFFKDRIEYEKSTAVFNGRECSYKEYEMWKNNIEELFLIEPYKNNYVMRLGDLLAYLQEDMVENTSNLEESSPEIPANTDPPAEPENVLSDERILQILGERYKDIGILYEESGTDEMFEGFVGGYSLDPNVSPCMRRIKVNKKTGEVTEMDPIGTVLNTYFIE